MPLTFVTCFVKVPERLLSEEPNCVEAQALLDDATSRRMALGR